MATSLRPTERANLRSSWPSFRWSMTTWRSATCCAQASRVGRRLAEEAAEGELGCILLDIFVADCSGPQLQDRLAASGSTAPIIFVTGHGDIPTTVRTIKAGAVDFLTKPVARAQLLDAIERALFRDEEARRRDSRAAALRSILARLTARECEVLALLARGKPHKQIAYDLGISERTVKFHRRHVLRKFRGRSLADLAIAADRPGLLSGWCDENFDREGDLKQGSTTELALAMVSWNRAADTAPMGNTGLEYRLLDQEPRLMADKLKISILSGKTCVRRGYGCHFRPRRGNVEARSPP